MEERREFDAVIALEVQYVVIVTAAGKKGYFQSFSLSVFLLYVFLKSTYFVHFLRLKDFVLYVGQMLQYMKHVVLQKKCCTSTRVSKNNNNSEYTCERKNVL